MAETHIVVIVRREVDHPEVYDTIQRHFYNADFTTAWYKAAGYIQSLTWDEKLLAVYQKSPLGLTISERQWLGQQ